VAQIAANTIAVAEDSGSAKTNAAARGELARNLVQSLAAVAVKTQNTQTRGDSAERQWQAPTGANSGTKNDNAAAATTDMSPSTKANIVNVLASMGLSALKEDRDIHPVLIRLRVGREAMAAVELTSKPRPGDMPLETLSSEGFSSPPITAVPADVPFTTPTRAAFHAFKAYVGGGIYLLPAAMKYAGYVPGVVLSALLAALTVDVCLMLANARMALSHVPGISSYGDVVGFVFSPRAKTALDATIAVAQFGYCVLYLQIAGYTVEEVTGNETVYPYVVLVGWLLSCVTAMNSHNISRLALVSAFSNVCGLFLISVTIIAALHKFATEGAHDSAPAFESFTNWFLYIPQLLGALCGICPMLPVFEAMDPATRNTTFPRMYAMTVGLVGVVYTVYGVVGFVAYGEHLKVSPVSLLPTNWIGSLARIVLATVMITTYPVQYLPGVLIIDEIFGVPLGTIVPKSPKAVRIRVATTVAIALVALLVDGSATGLIFAFLGSTVIVAQLMWVPPLIALQYKHALARPVEERGRLNLDYLRPIIQPSTHSNKLLFVRAWGYMALGLMVLIIGLTQFFQAI
jgi:proton-coupled amino acid transporter